MKQGISTTVENDANARVHSDCMQRFNQACSDGNLEKIKASLELKKITLEDLVLTNFNCLLPVFANGYKHVFKFFKNEFNEELNQALCTNHELLEGYLNASFFIIKSNKNSHFFALISKCSRDRQLVALERLLEKMPPLQWNMDIVKWNYATYLAIECGDIAVINMLLSLPHVRDTDDHILNVLRNVARSGQLAIVQYLLAKPEVARLPPNRLITAMLDGARIGKKEEILAFVSSNISLWEQLRFDDDYFQRIQFKNMIDAFELGQSQYINRLLARPELKEKIVNKLKDLPISKLFANAARRNHFSTILLLITLPGVIAQIDAYTFSLIYARAARHGDCDMVEFLFNSFPERFKPEDHHSAMHDAASMGRLTVVKILLPLVDGLFSPKINVAAKHGRIGVCEFLLSSDKVCEDLLKTELSPNLTERVLQGISALFISTQSAKQRILAKLIKQYPILQKAIENRAKNTQAYVGTLCLAKVSMRTQIPVNVMAQITYLLTPENGKTGVEFVDAVGIFFELGKKRTASAIVELDSQPQIKSRRAPH